MDVQLPDGSIARFPDDMPETQIRTALMKITQQQPAALAPAAPDRTSALAASTVGAASGLTGNFFDEIASAAMTPIEMGIGAYNGQDAGKGFMARAGDAYGRALDKNRDYEATARSEHPVAATVGDVGGGMALGGTAAANGLTIMRAPAQAATTAMQRGGQIANMLGRAGAEGASYGGVYGAGSGQGTADRFDRALQGATIGGAAGAGLAGAAAGIGVIGRTAGAPITSRINPDAATRTALLRTLQRSGQTPEDIVAALQGAQADGQGVYTVADALGHPGQRMMSAIARTPGDGRQAVVEALEGRQAGQGRRIANALAEGFDAPDTAVQRTAALTEARRGAGNANYQAARAQAGAVDVSDAVSAIDDVLTPGATRIMSPNSAIADDSVEGALRRARGLLTDGRSNLSDFTNVHRAQQDIADMAEAAQRSGNMNRARMLGDVNRRLNTALASASEPYAAAQQAYAQGSREIEAVGTGRAAATRGRSEDTTRTFGAMAPGEQSAFRAGYADPLIEGAQGGAIGVNKARPLINDATAVEFPAFAAPGRADQLGRRIGREQTMFETRNQALGGSRTADNLADQAELGMLDPSIVGRAIAGDFLGAVKQFGVLALRQMQGMPESVRTRMATQLLQTNPTRAGADLAQAIARGEELSAAQIAAIRATAQQGGQRAGTSR